MNRTVIAAGLAMGAALALPAGAHAQATIFMDDAEGDPAAKWVIGQPPERIEPWQPASSSTQKFRGNQFKNGKTSYWSGVTPNNWPTVPSTAPAGADVVEGESLLTLKEPVVIPVDGETTLSYWSLFQNEGDDTGISQIAPISSDNKIGAWKNLKTDNVANTSAGTTDPKACDPSRPDTPFGFEEQKASLKPYAGFKVLIRFNLKYGAENRPVSHPCGWYLDDIKLSTTGTVGKLGGSTATTVAPPTPGGGGGGPMTSPPAVKPAVKFNSLKGKKKKATLALTVSGSGISNAKVTVLKGKKRVATGKAAFLAVGKGKVAFKLKKKLRKGKYTIKLTGKAADGSAVKAAAKVKGR
jgi:hypothetical protein